MKLKRTLAMLGMILLPLVAACTPAQIELFKSLPHDKQVQVIQAIQRQNTARSRDCYSAINKHWPGDKSWARKIVWRESRNNPAAANPRSSARGCAQLLQSYHAHRYYKVGCTPAQWANPDCNIKAAWTLYQEAGTSPWALTNY